MTRAILAFKNWTITPDREAGAEPVTHAMECQLCGDRSDASGDWDAPQSWALRHSGRSPSHTNYREVITRPYKTRMEG